MRRPIEWPAASRDLRNRIVGYRYSIRVPGLDQGGYEVLLFETFASQPTHQIGQPATSILQLSLTDSDPHRAARTLNAIASAYVARTRDVAGAAKAVLDSAVAPPLPFRNSPAQLFGVSLAIGIVAAIALAFAASALEERMRRL